MALWSREQVEQVLSSHGWEFEEKGIQGGVQFQLHDGTRINHYATGKVVIQGRPSNLRDEIDQIFNGRTVQVVPSGGDAARDRKTPPQRVFIVYGHDVNAREQLEPILRRLHLEPIVLQNVPATGDTIIEKLETLRDCLSNVASGAMISQVGRTNRRAYGFIPLGRQERQREWPAGRRFRRGAREKVMVGSADQTAYRQYCAASPGSSLDKQSLTDADFACVLLTPDDEGYRRDQSGDKKFRARQNVVLELGMVLARLGRKRAAVLVKEDNLERPSDIDGLIYLPFQSRVEEIINKIAASLQQAGFDIQVSALIT